MQCSNPEHEPIDRVEVVGEEGWTILDATAEWY
jgi:hypothetical protein